MGTEVHVSALPKCDVHHGEHDAQYDARTVQGPWANMCEQAFKQVGRGLGTGLGQRLILGDPEEKSKADEAKEIREAVESGDWDLAEDLIGDRDPADFF